MTVFEAVIISSGKLIRLCQYYQLSNSDALASGFENSQIMKYMDKNVKCQDIQLEIASVKIVS